MPTVTSSFAKFTMSQRGNQYTPVTKKWSLGFPVITDPITITAATLSIFVETNYGTLRLINQKKTAGITNARSASYNVFDWFKGAKSLTGSEYLQFSFASNDQYSSSVEVHGYGSTSASLVLTLTYTYDYTPCTPPTTVELDSETAAPNGTVRLSWSGAGDGNNNPVASYTVHRSTDGTTWTVLQTDITDEYLDVEAPSVLNGVYYYSVVAVGTQADYSSVRSDPVMLTCYYTAPSVSGVQLNSGTETVYVPVGGNAVLSWSGTDGTNNPITKYSISRNGTFLTETTGTSLTVDAPAAGANYYYNITPIGTCADGTAVGSPTMYAYSSPSAPSNIALAKPEAGKGENVLLSWSNASAGIQNAITGYRVYRSTSEDGTYTQLGEDIPSTATSGSLTVTSDTRNGRSYYYKVATIGVHSVGAMSATVVRLHTVWTAPTVTAISLSSDTVAPGASSTLNFNVADGTNNPITGIEVYQGETLLATLAASARSYSVTSGSTAGDEETFSIKPLGTVEDGAMSTSVTLKSYGDPTPPTSVIVSNSQPDAGTSVTLSWSGASDGLFNPIQSYAVLRSTGSSSGPYIQIATVTGTSTSVTASSTMGEVYYYKVRAVGAHSTSAYSSAAPSVTAKVYTVPGAPVASVSPSESGYGDSPVLSWTAASDGTNNPVTGYRVYRSSDGSTFNQLGSDLAANVLSLSVDPPATMGASYYYRVYALAAKAGFTISASSNTVQLKRKIYTSPSAPVATISGNLQNPGTTYTVSWSGSEAGTNNPISGYRVYRSTGGSFTMYGEYSSSILSFIETVGAFGSRYQYKIVALGTIPGFDSVESNTVTIIANSPPSNITSITQPDRVYESGTITFSWPAVSDPNGNFRRYNVEMRIEHSSGGTTGWLPWQSFKTVTDPQFTYALSDANVPRGMQFQFRVNAEDQLGLVSGWTETNPLIRNSLPVTPVVVYPTTSTLTYDARPYVVVNISADPDGHGQYIDMSVDDGEFVQVDFPNLASGNRTIRCPSSLEVGEHTIAVRTRDALGAVSETVSVNVEIADPAWLRDIERGTVVSRPVINKASASSYTVTFYDAVEEKPIKIECSKTPKVTYDIPTTDPFAPGSGRNKLYFPHNHSDVTSYGLKLSYQKTGKYYLSGRPTNIPNYYLVSSQPTPNGNYYFYYTISNSNYASNIVLKLTANSGDTAISMSPNTRYPVTVTNGVLYSLRLQVQNLIGSNMTCTISAMLLEEDDDSNEFVPYANIGDFDYIFSMRIEAGIRNGIAVIIQKRIATIPYNSIVGSNGYGFDVACNGDGTGTITNKYGYIASYNGETLPNKKWYSSYDKYVAGRSPSIGAEVVYPLDTPVEYLFSDIEVDKLLKLENVILEDSHEINSIAVTYRTIYSHQAEIEQLYDYVNTCKAYYNLSAIDVPESVGEDYSNAGSGKIGMFAAWGSQMLALYNALKEVCTLLGIAAPEVTITSGMPPTAGVINTIRTMITSL